MKQSILEDIRKLKSKPKTTRALPQTSPKVQKPKKTWSTLSQSPSTYSLDAPKSNNQSDSSTRSINPFKGLLFCIPMVDIELTPTRISILKKSIKRMGGIIIQNLEHDERFLVDYIVVSAKTKISCLNSILKPNIGYRKVILYQYVIECEKRNKNLSAESFEVQFKPVVEKKWAEDDITLHKKVIYEVETDGEADIRVLKKARSQLDRSKFMCQKGSCSDMGGMKKFICDELMKLQNIYENEKDVGRKIAYLKAVSAIKSYHKEIQTQKDVDGLPGIGKKMSNKIKQLIQTGSLQKLQSLKQSQQRKCCEQLCRVWGIGPSSAQQLYNKGVKSLKQLQERQDLLNSSQRIGLKYVEEFESRIPRVKVGEIHEVVRKIIDCLAGEGVYRSQVCGSYRRGKASCGDIDVIITRNDGIFDPRFLVDLISKLEESQLITDHLSLPKTFLPDKSTSYMGVCLHQTPTHHRIDIKHYPLQQYPFALLYFTGSDMFNRSMRLFARKKGYSLSDHGLAMVQRHGPNNKSVLGRIAVKSEEQIFEALELQYKTPEQRNL